jgi:PAS domain S-box-containing protein
MHRDLRKQIKDATEKSGINKLDFIELLKLIDQHYDKMEATITQSLTSKTLTATTTPIEVIFDSVTEALLSVSEEGTIRNANKVCLRYFGIAKDDLIGASIVGILPDSKGRTLADFLQPYQSDIDDTSVEFSGGEVNAARSSGEIFTAEMNSSSLRVGDERVFVISLRDVTGRREAEKSLRENEERYRALVENAPEAIVVLDVESNRFVDANANACALFNLSRKRLLSIGPQAISPRTQPDGTPSFGVRRGFIERALNGEHPVFEWMHKNFHGTEFPCEVRFSKLPSQDRSLIRVSITDIAERKRNEQFAYAQNKILEMVAANTACDRTLKSICHVTTCRLRSCVSTSGARHCPLSRRPACQSSSRLRWTLSRLNRMELPAVRRCSQIHKRSLNALRRTRPGVVSKNSWRSMVLRQPGHFHCMAPETGS